MLNRRRHPRMPILKDIAKEVYISTDTGFFPGIIMNLSSGGMMLMLYCDLAVNTEVCLVFDFPGFETSQIFGKIVRLVKRAVIWETAIQFTRISEHDENLLNKLAEDYVDCENKITLGAVDVCTKNCSYYGLCDKRFKIK